MYWTNIRQPTVHVQQNIFGKTLIEVCSPHLYASYGTFCVQIGQLVTAQWVFEHLEEFRNWRHFPSKTAVCRFLKVLQRLTVPRIYDQFGRKRCLKKRKDVDYKLLKKYSQKYFVVHEQSAVKNLFSTYVCYTPDGLFWVQPVGLLKLRKTRITSKFDSRMK